jgi:hypothetical protein
MIITHWLEPINRTAQNGELGSDTPIVMVKDA